MSPQERTAEVKVLRKSRTISNLAILLVLLPIMVFMYRNYNDFAAWISGIDRAQIADLGVEIIQPFFVTLIYISGGIVSCATLAAFIQPQFKENAFGPTCSRFAILFCLLFAGFCFIAGSLL